MKTNYFLSIALVVLPLQARSEVEKSVVSKADSISAHELKNVIIPNLTAEVSNIYDAMSVTLAMTSKTNLRVDRLKFAIGPTSQRGHDLPCKLDLKNVTIEVAVQYWTELYRYSYKYDRDCIYLTDLARVIPKEGKII